MWHVNDPILSLRHNIATREIDRRYKGSSLRSLRYGVSWVASLNWVEYVLNIIRCVNRSLKRWTNIRWQDISLSHQNRQIFTQILFLQIQLEQKLLLALTVDFQFIETDPQQFPFFSIQSFNFHFLYNENAMKWKSFFPLMNQLNVDIEGRIIALFFSFAILHEVFDWSSVKIIGRRKSEFSFRFTIKISFLHLQLHPPS